MLSTKLASAKATVVRATASDNKKSECVCLDPHGSRPEGV
jgi:hypothetical protein